MPGKSFSSPLNKTNLERVHFLESLFYLVMWVEVGTAGRSMACWTETALTLNKFWVARRSSSHCTLRLMQTPYTSVADMRREKLFSLPCTGNLRSDDQETNKFLGNPPCCKLFAQSHQIRPQQLRFLLLDQGSFVPESVTSFNLQYKSSI